jgi:LuxR family transcriptional regulator, maltose regulon positive regulatory protein
MYVPILATKLHIPTPQARVVPRPHLLERLDEGLLRKLTLVSAPAGFGKTTKSFGESIYATAATLCLGQLQEAENELFLAGETYRRVLVLAGDPPRPIACEAHLGLGRTTYQWNDLDASEWHVQRCLQLTRQMDSVDTFAACRVLLARLKLAEPGGFVRIFVDEGMPLGRLLVEAAGRGIIPYYTAKLMAVFEAEQQADEVRLPAGQPLTEKLSERELEVLQLVAEGLSNREIGARLFLALDTVKGHNRRIFAKLGVKRRTEAVAKARYLAILPHQD